jgi:hypothetical protein
MSQASGKEQMRALIGFKHLKSEIKHKKVCHKYCDSDRVKSYADSFSVQMRKSYKININHYPIVEMVEF